MEKKTMGSFLAALRRANGMTQKELAERLNVSEAMKQAQRDSELFKDGAPAVFHRRSRESWLVTMRLADWIELYRARDTVSINP